MSGISVITPVYNGADFIEETVSSVLAAINGRRIQYIVVNDGSTDQTLSKVLSFGDAVQVISQINAGESAAVNAGLNASIGDFIMIVSADDPLPTEEIFDGVEDFFNENPGVVAWYPNWQMIDIAGKTIKTMILPECSEELLLGRVMCLPGPGTIFRSNAARAINGRNESRRFAGDYDFWLRLSRVGLLKNRPTVLAQWRHHQTSTSVALRGREMGNERITIIQDFLKDYTVDPRIARMALSHAYYFAAALSFQDTSVKARSLLIRAFILRRGYVEGAKLRVIAFIFLLPFSRRLARIALRISPRLRNSLD